MGRHGVNIACREGEGVRVQLFREGGLAAMEGFGGVEWLHSLWEFSPWLCFQAGAEGYVG